MAYEVISAKKCRKCNAITVTYYNDNCELITNSMPISIFHENFPGSTIDKDVYESCDYCTNHWGVDLCACGSGQKVGECQKGHFECLNKVPMQRIGENIKRGYYEY